MVLNWYPAHTDANPYEHPIQSGYLPPEAMQELGADIHNPQIEAEIRQAYAEQPVVLGHIAGRGSQEPIGPNREADFFALPGSNPDEMNIPLWGEQMGPLKYTAERALGMISAARLGLHMGLAHVHRAAMDAHQALLLVNKGRDWVLGTAGVNGHKYDACQALGKVLMPAVLTQRLGERTFHRVVSPISIDRPVPPCVECDEKKCYLDRKLKKATSSSTA